MYAKVFAQIFDSSLREKWQAWVVFMALLVLADENDDVDMTPEALAARTGLPGSIVSEGLAWLEKPDPFSRSPECEGRRIIRLDDHRAWGWHIVNRRKYRAIRDNRERRDYFREQKQKQRECPPMSTAVHQRQPHEVGSRKNEVEIKEEPTPTRSDASRADASPRVFELPLRDGTTYGVTEADCVRWKKFYPDVLILETLREQAAWLDSNPDRRKTRRGMKRFINGWFLKEQNTPIREAVNGTRKG
jgi:hypothetical protein